jgi:uncharacterized membrane protein YebE (DUF533 family)
MTIKQIYIVAGLAAAAAVGYYLYQKKNAPAVHTTVTPPVTGNSTPSSGAPTNGTAQTIGAAASALDALYNEYA